MKDACSSQQSGVGSVSVGFGGCKHNPPLPASQALSHPVCFPWNWCKCSWECFSSGRDQGRTSSSPECPGLTQSRTRELWTWECSGCECTPALLLQLCKKFPFSQPCAIGGFTAIPTSLDFLHSKLLLFTFSLTLQSMVGFKSAFQHGNEWINFLLSDE